MSAQLERDYFWGVFDKYVEKLGNKFFVTHKKNGVNQAAGNINNISPMAMQTICCEYKYLEQTILVQVYINKNEKLFNYLHEKKEGAPEDRNEDTPLPGVMSNLPVVEWEKREKSRETRKKSQNFLKITFNHRLYFNID